MNKDLIKIIQDKKLTCIIISPHEDDALLSCGSLIAHLSGKVDITVVNIFTKAHEKPYTFSARKYLNDLGYVDANALYIEREKEDKKALSSFSTKTVNLGLEDALFRRKKQPTFLGKLVPELDHVYPTYRWHILKGIASNDYAVALLKKKLEPYKNKKTLVFAPYGIGHHVDHLIARKVCEKLFDNLVLYSDFPYNIRLHKVGKVLRNGESYRLTPDMKEKAQIIKAYKTQFLGLFPNGKVPMHEEMYFSKGKFLV